ncbi:MAG: CvpA family protein [Erysipelotrichaceae bacterium]|nr:CvpA family protein [Erysipelotrichaceae bacterium]
MVIPENCYIFISGFIVLIYLIMIYLGYKRGFLYELLSVVYTLASILIAWFTSPVLASLFPIFDLNSLDEKYELLNKIYDFNSILNTIAYFLIVFLMLKLLYVFISLLVKSLNKVPVIGSLNKTLGGLFGIFHATLITLALSLLLSLPLFKNGAQVKEKTLFKYVNSASDEVFSYLVDLIADAKLKDGGETIDISSYRQEFKDWLISVIDKNE